MKAQQGVCATQVFDHVPELSLRGAGLGLTTNGLSALETISPELLKHVCSVGTMRAATVVFTANGNQSRPWLACLPSNLVASGSAQLPLVLY